MVGILLSVLTVICVAGVVSISAAIIALSHAEQTMRSEEV